MENLFWKSTTVYKPLVKITTVDFVIFTTKDLTYVYNSICKYIWVLNNDGHLVEADFFRSCFSFLDALESHRWRSRRGNRGMKFSGFTVLHLSLGLMPLLGSYKG